MENINLIQNSQRTETHEKETQARAAAIRLVFIKPILFIVGSTKADAIALKPFLAALSFVNEILLLNGY